MNNVLVIFILAAGFVGSVCAEDVKSGVAADEKPMPLLRDGFSLPSPGVIGLITKAKGRQQWFFSPYKNISDMRSTVLAGWSVELLPSSTLEGIIKTMEIRDAKSSSMEVKLWGKVTKYSNKAASKRLYFNEKAKDEVFARNYIFPVEFIAITTVKDKTTDSDPEVGLVKDPDDPNSIIPFQAKKIFKKSEDKTEKDQPVKRKKDSILPDEVWQELKLPYAEDLKLREKAPKVLKDVSLTNRTGFITQGDGYKIFTIDAMGRNVDNSSYKLLFSETLERTERDIVTSPGRNRYKVSGTITMFKGEYYMLMHRAVKTYNHGNFAR